MDSEPARYLRTNSHRLHLGRIGFKYLSRKYTDVKVEDITGINQVLDLWEGVIKSVFILTGDTVQVETCAHPELDQIAVRVQSPDLNRLSLGIGFDFPYGSSDWGKTAYDWNSPQRHRTEIIDKGKNYVKIRHQLDSTTYYIEIHWEGTARFKKIKTHSYFLG